MAARALGLFEVTIFSTGQVLMGSVNTSTRCARMAIPAPGCLQVDRKQIDQGAGYAG